MVYNSSEAVYQCNVVVFLMSVLLLTMESMLFCSPLLLDFNTARVNKTNSFVVQCFSVAITFSISYQNLLATKSKYS